MTLGKDRAKRLARLATPKGRRDDGLVLVDSPALVDEALRLGLLRELVFVPGAQDERVGRARDAGVTLTETDEGTLRRIADVETPAGVVGVAAPPPGLTADRVASPDARLVYLEGLADPGNVGTIARTSAAFGADGLVLSPGCADPLAPKTLRSSAGALLRVPFLRASLDELRPAARVLRTVVRGGVPLGDVDRGAGFVLWLGNEARGVGAPPDGVAVMDVSIPMTGATESLNVAAAAAILLWELARDQ